MAGEEVADSEEQVKPLKTQSLAHRLETGLHVGSTRAESTACVHSFQSHGLCFIPKKITTLSTAIVLGNFPSSIPTIIRMSPANNEMALLPCTDWPLPGVVIAGGCQSVWIYLCQFPGTKLRGKRWEQQHVWVGAGSHGSPAPSHQRLPHRHQNGSGQLSACSASLCDTAANSGYLATSLAVMSLVQSLQVRCFYCNDTHPWFPTLLAQLDASIVHCQASVMQAGMLCRYILWFAL